MRDMKEGREFWTGLTRFTGFLKGTVLTGGTGGKKFQQEDRKGDEGHEGRQGILDRINKIYRISEGDGF
jgi:hypothetical protein